jgi:hypothetical protein
MNILTDILSLIRRGVFTKVANPDDVLVLGVNEQPDMTGVASPIPYKSVKLIKIKDLKIASAFCNNENTDESSPAIFQKQEINSTTNICTNYFRALKSLSPNLLISESIDDNYVEFTSTAEPNAAANLGEGVGLYAGKTGETLNFKSLIGAGVSITQTDSEVTINHATKLILNSPDGSIWEVTVSNTGGLQTVSIG